MPKIVLVEPQIPPNTGNIARTCAATNTPLHLVAPLGFEISDRHLKRAGLDYWQFLNLEYHKNIDKFLKIQTQLGGRMLGFSVRGKKNYLDCQFQENDWLLFGSETEGLPLDLQEKCEETLYLPMPHEKVRSLNLSVSVAVALFEAYRQLNYQNK